jgi:gliding motility-associated-like protein
MNSWDPAGNWILEQGGSRITGGNLSANYGPLLITQTATSAQALLQVTAGVSVRGVRLQFPEGSFLIRIQHPTTGCSEEMLLTVWCEDLNDLIAVNDSVATIRNRSVRIRVLGNDVYDALSLGDLRIVRMPSHGTVYRNEALELVYTPDKDFCGEDQLEYAICHEDGYCDTATVYIDVRCLGIVVHNGFSPNNDGVNDRFTIDGIEAFPNNELHVFNRWGNQVFFQKGYKNNWDGSWDGSALPDGTYFYIFEDGEGRRYSGYVQIHR